MDPWEQWLCILLESPLPAWLMSQLARQWTARREEMRGITFEHYHQTPRSPARMEGWGAAPALRKGF